jgi:hypothetical protein
MALQYAGVLYLTSESVTYYGCLTWIGCIVGADSGQPLNEYHHVTGLPLPSQRAEPNMQRRTELERMSPDQLERWWQGHDD